MESSPPPRRVRIWTRLKVGGDKGASWQAERITDSVLHALHSVQNRWSVILLPHLVRRQYIINKFLNRHHDEMGRLPLGLRSSWYTSTPPNDRLAPRNEHVDRQEKPAGAEIAMPIGGQPSTKQAFTAAYR